MGGKTLIDTAEGNKFTMFFWEIVLWLISRSVNDSVRGAHDGNAFC